MRWRLFVPLVSLAALLLLSGDRARADAQKNQGQDKTPPVVVLTAPDAAPLTFQVSVRAEDDQGISTVFLAVAGEIVQGRMEPPYVFTLTVPRLPIEVCALAEDKSGNSSKDCRVVQPRGALDCFENGTCAQGEFCLRPEGDCGGSGACAQRAENCSGVFEPVCGCDDRTYSNECLAHASGVSVARKGECGGTLSQFQLTASPQELLACTDILTLTARVMTTGGRPAPGVLVIFDEVPPSTLTGFFSPGSQVFSDGNGEAVVLWTPSVSACVQACTVFGDPNSTTGGACELFFTARDDTGALESAPVQVLDNIL